MIPNPAIVPHIQTTESNRIGWLEISLNYRFRHKGIEKRYTASKDLNGQVIKIFYDEKYLFAIYEVVSRQIHFVGEPNWVHKAAIRNALMVLKS